MTFLWLGCTSFGGPIAHLQYFRRTLVEQRGWLDEAAYARIVAFCSVLPGPTSSQVGMVLGLVRAGPLGAFAAWFAFTAPSAVLMTCAAAALVTVGGDAPVWLGGLLDGLFAAAAAVVLLAVVALARSLCTGFSTAAIAAASTFIALALRAFPGTQWAPIAAGALIGAIVLRAGPAPGAAGDPLPVRVPRAVSIVASIVFVVLIGVTLLPRSATTTLLGAMVRTGALVFGGGHVVLPLLQGLVRDGVIGERMFFAGYGIVQAMPGPISTFATYLGYANSSPLHGAAGALAATLLVFAPSFALIFVLAPIWNRIASLPRIGAALRGANASVVGLLASVLIDPIAGALWGSWPRIAIAVIAFAAIARLRVAPWIVVISAAIVGAIARA